MHILQSAGIQSLLAELQNRGFTVVGPTLRDGAIVLDVITSADELPKGWTDIQESAAYHLELRSDEALFGYVVGPFSWKRFLFPPRQKMFTATKAGKGFTVTSAVPDPLPRYAFLGVRPCEIQALAIQDRIFMEGPYADTYYVAVRKASCVIVVNCVEPGGTCFCVSMQTGPRATQGFDLAMTEVRDGGKGYFTLQTGSPLGEELLGALQCRPAEGTEIRAAEEKLEAAAGRMGRRLDMTDIRKVFSDTFDHPHWEVVAKRCLSCANCTLVCPTCFCSTVEDLTDLAGAHAERWRRWDSCFTTDFTKVAGGNIRMSTRTRYRQWLTHKLANWIDQFGTPGCVGCGRCITWCPVGIDITTEAATFRENSVVSTNP